MDLELLQRATELFDELLDLPADERARRLAGEPAGVVEIVVDMLEADAGASVFDDPHALSPVMPERLGSFAVIREIGRGGMGVVYEAEQERPRRRVALKTLLRRDDGAAAIAQFETEVHALARVLHPAIPQIYEVFEVAGMPVMAMELVDGLGLGEVSQTLSEREIVTLLAEVAEAVDHVHDRGVVHGDLKPGNVLVTGDGRPKVLDFGIARLQEAQRAIVAGTMAYVAPEQLAGEETDGRADVYSLGVMLYELLVGSLPIDTTDLTTHGLVRRKALGPDALAGVSPPLATVVRRSLEADPEDRYPTAASFAAQLRRYAAHEPVVGHRYTGVEEATLWFRRSRGRLLFGAGMTVVVGLSAVAATAWLDERRARQRDADAVALLDAARSAEDPDVAEEIFRSLVDDPRYEGSAVPSVAWRWHGLRDPEIPDATDLALAYAEAERPEDALAALRPLVQVLATRGDWRGVEGVSALLPAEEAPLLRASAALRRGDYEGAADAAPTWAPLFERISRATILPMGRGGTALEQGGFVIDHDDELVWYSPDLQRIHGWPRDRGGARALEVVGDEVWTFHRHADRQVASRTTLSVDGAQTEHEQVDDGLLMFVGDVDGDGTEERYHVQLGRDVMRVADPYTATTADDDSGFGAHFINESALVNLVRGPSDAWLVAHPNNSGPEFVGVYDAAGSHTLLRFGSAGAAWMSDGPVRRMRMTGMAPGLDRRGSPEPQPERGHLLTLASTEGGPWAVEDAQRLLRRARHIVRGDVDGDGLVDDVLEMRYGGVLVGLAADPGRWAVLDNGWLHTVGDIDRDGVAEIVMHDDSVAWVLGIGDAVPPNAADWPRSAPEPVPAFVPDGLRERWSRAEALAAAGLADEAASVFAQLGVRRTEVGNRALERAVHLATKARTGDRVGWVASLREREPGRHETLAESVLRTAHDWEALAALRGGIPPRLPLVSASGVHEALSTDLAEAVRFSAHDGVLEVDLMAGPGHLRVPVRWEGGPVELRLGFDPEVFDLGTGFELELAFGETRAGIRIKKQKTHGRLDGDAYFFNTWRGDLVDLLEVSWADASPNVWRISVDPSAASVRMGSPGEERSAPLTFAPDGEGVLTLSYRPAVPNEGGLIRARIHTLDVRGLTPVGVGTREDGVPSVRRRLRTAFLRWATPLSAELGDAYADAVLAAWRSAVRYDLAAAAPVLEHPTIAGLGVDDPAARTLQLARAAWLARRGRAEELAPLLDALTAVDAVDEDRNAWEIATRVRLGSGDRAGAAEAARHWWRTAYRPFQVGHWLATKPEFAGLVPEATAVPRYPP
jgi:predicted Ser/Thr protein kinase